MNRALFDLDDTLIDHDSFTRFTFSLLKRSPLRMLGAALTVPALLVLLSRGSWRVHAGSILLWTGTVGVADSGLDRLVREHVAALRVGERIRPDAGRALAAHLDAGEEVVVVTGCAERLAVPLCREIDPRIRVVGSTLRRRAGGWVALRHCRGRGKVEMLVEAGLAEDVVAAYGDGLSDVPMLDLARTAVLVGLSESAEKKARARLVGPERVLSVRWPARGEPSRGRGEPV
ncbi:haloacid dehalogenase-like hydrolase [Nocardiopsis alba]|uniref:haloacid dehalogenase-like hydrolase n=1 Tax=Nocardiopsis alba TaxID=53437 RepID=UPI0033B129DD